MIRVKAKNKDIVLGENVKIANSFLSRLQGLMFIKEMVGFDGLLIKRCNSIHNFFVRFPIDAIFLDANFKIVKIKRNFRPWAISGMYFRATQVLEIKGGSLSDEINENDYLEVENV